MGGFLERLRSGLIRFMYGRNGSDQLNMALLVLYLVLFLLQSILAAAGSEAGVSLCSGLMTASAIVLLWRTFSRNLERRRSENERFLRWWRPVKGRLRGAKTRLTDREHKYFTCPGCKALCRVPKGKGSIEITCPRCGGKIRGKS